MDTQQWMQAAETGNSTTLETLLTDGCDINVSTESGASGLMCASAGGHTPAVELLLARGAHINARRHDGWTALTLAAFFGHAEVVEVLLHAGADPQSADDSNNTALDWAARRGQVEIAALLRCAAVRAGSAPPRRHDARAADNGAATESVGLRAEAPDEMTLLRQHAAAAGATSSPPLRVSARLESFSQQRGRNNALRARTRVNERKRAHRSEGPRPLAIAASANSTAPPIVTAGSHERRGRNSIKALRFSGGAALWLLTFSCTAYTLMSVLGLNVHVNQQGAPDQSGAQLAPGKPPTAVLTIPTANVQPAPVAPASAPEAKLRRAAGVTAAGGGEMRGVLNQTRASGPRKPERSAAHAPQLADADAARAGRKQDSKEPVLVSQAQANEATKTQRESATANHASAGGQHQTHLPPRFVAPLAAPASPPPSKSPRRKVIPWP